MFGYRVSIIAMTIWVAFLLNLERIDNLIFVGQVNISSFVYLLSIVIMMGLLVFPNLVKLPLRLLIIPVLLVYGIGKLVTPHSPVSPSYFLFVSVVEVISLIMTAWLIQKLAGSIEQFNVAIAYLADRKEKTQVLDLREGERLIQRKLQLARRFERNLAILSINIRESSSGPLQLWDQEEKVRYIYLQTQIAELMNYVLEPNDIRLWHHGNLVICIPEASLEKAQQISDQIRQTLREVLGIHINVGVGCFPQDGLLYQDLLAVAASNVEGTLLTEQSLAA